MGKSSTDGFRNIHPSVSTLAPLCQVENSITLVQKRLKAKAQAAIQAVVEERLLRLLAMVDLGGDDHQGGWLAGWLLGP